MLSDVVIVNINTEASLKLKNISGCTTTMYGYVINMDGSVERLEDTMLWFEILQLR